MFLTLVEGLIQRIPSRCAVCHAWPSHNVCDDCVARFAQPAARCRICACVVPQGMTRCGACVATPPPLNAALAAVTYGYPWAGLIGEFKFREHTGWARRFGSLMRNTPWAEPVLDAADWILPMPLSRERLRQRGFNQSLLLARALGYGTKVRADLLLRVGDAPAQSSLPRKDRIANVQHVFTTDPLMTSQIRNRSVLLVDDVMTTGASLHACAQVLLRAGVAQVSALVLARTE